MPKATSIPPPNPLQRGNLLDFPIVAFYATACENQADLCYLCGISVLLLQDATHPPSNNQITALLALLQVFLHLEKYSRVGKSELKSSPNPETPLKRDV